MVTFNVYKSTASGTYVEGVCLTTDEKPIAGIANGSILFAVDPSDGGMIRYMFNQSSASWVETECPCSGGGGGGGSGGGSVVRCPLTVETTGTRISLTAEMTAAELLTADQIIFEVSNAQGTITDTYPCVAVKSGFRAFSFVIVCIDNSGKPVFVSLFAPGADFQPQGEYNGGVG